MSNSQGAPVAGLYRVFDTVIASSIALPELVALRGVTPQLAIQPLDTPGVREEDYVSSFEWHDGGGRVICRSSRCGEQYLLVFPQQAIFQIAGRVIRYAALGEADLGLLRHILLSQVLPRCLAHAGNLMLHASAVTLPDGRTVAFIGATGSGKSTLVCYLRQQGASWVDDDCILLRPGTVETIVSGGVPTLRLHADSVAALGARRGDFTPYLDYSSKRQAIVRDGSADAAGSHRLDAAYLLEPAAGKEADSEVHVRLASGQAATMALVDSAFNLDPACTETMARTFSTAGDALRTPLPVYHLHYPRDYAALPRVYAALQ